MKLKLTFILVLCATLFINAQTANIQGDPYNGNPYATITEAIQAAQDGDVILITGVHTESIGISKSITLRGTDPTTDIIQAAGTAASDGTGSRVISLSRANETDVLTISIENLGIRNGNADSNSNGGGIDADKITGMLTLNNLIIENNHTDKNGGGISLAGSNATIVNCTIQNNSSSLDGAGIIMAPNNGAAIDSTIDISQTLIYSNIGRNGGGVFVNGNAGFGNNYKIDVNITNTTIANNDTTSGSNGAGGGGIWCKGAPYLNGSGGNITLKLVHATLVNNTHASAAKNGIQFTNSSGPTNFSIYNSIVVSNTEIAQKALNFANSNTMDVVNCILGGLNAAPTAIIDDANKNNQKGKLPSEVGFADLQGDIPILTVAGGKTQVFAIADGSNAHDYCTATTGVSIPNLDQRGYQREGSYDAGAFEFGATPLSLIDNELSLSLKIYPNPSSSIIRISGIENIKSIKVYSLLGALEKVYVNQNVINVNGLAKGVHFAVIKNDVSSVSTRFVVE